MICDMVRTSWTDEELDSYIRKLRGDSLELLKEVVKRNGKWTPAGSSTLTNAYEGLTKNAHNLGKYKIVFNDNNENGSAKPLFAIHNIKSLNQLRRILAIRP